MKKKTKTYKYNPNEWDESKSVAVAPEQRPSGFSTSICLPKGMVTKVKKIARKKGDVG